MDFPTKEAKPAEPVPWNVGVRVEPSLALLLLIPGEDDAEWEEDDPAP